MIAESKIETAIREHFQYFEKTIRTLQSLYEHERLVVAGIARFGGRYYVYAPRIIWVLDVSNFREAEPVIEFIENWRPKNFTLECVKSQDHENFGHRDFDFPGLRLTCALKDDSPTCRKEIVGYFDPQPIYKFVCEEDA